MFCIISQNLMEAHFSRFKPQEGTFSSFFEFQIDLGYESVITTLNQNKIIFGLKLELIKNIIHKQELTEKKLLIAEGTLPQHEGTEIKFHFEHAKLPEIEKNAQVNFHHLGFGLDVFEGQLLAEQNILGPGVQGRNIFDKELPFKKSQINPLTWNSNVRIEKAGSNTKFYSKINGVLINNIKDSLVVEKELRIRGDVDYHTGNLSTSCNIEIEGDVLSGFHVRSQGSILVRGSVEKNAVLEAEKNVTIERGALNGAIIISNGNIDIKYIQGANLKAAGNIYVKNHCYDSICFCEKKFECLNPKFIDNKGTVIGGTINAIEEIKLFSVGSSGATTKLIAGFNETQFREIQTIETLYLETQGEIKRLSRNLSINLLSKNITSEFESLPKPEKVKNVKILKKISQLKSQKITLGSQLKELGSQKSSTFLSAKIHIVSRCIPDLFLCINNCNSNVYEEKRGLIASYKNESICIEELAN